MKKYILFLTLSFLLILFGKNDIVSASQKKQTYVNNGSTQLVVTPKGDNGKNRDNEIRQFKLSNLEPTGVYLKKGDTITVASDSDASSYLSLGPYGKYAEVNNGEEFTEEVPLKKGTISYTMEHDFAIVYIRNISTDQEIHVTITGGRKLPTYRLGITDEKSFKKELEEMTDSPFYELVGNRVFGTFQYSKTKDLILENPSVDNLVKYWDKIFELEGETYGLTENDTYGAMNKFKERAQIINTDEGGGAAYAHNDYVSFHIKGGLYKDLLSYTGQEQQWGLWHEFGHVFQSPLLLWEADSGAPGNLEEITVNLSSLYIEKALGFRDRILGEQNARTVMKEFLSAPNEGKNFDNGENSEVIIGSDMVGWLKLGMFDQLMMAYGNNIYAYFMNQARLQSRISPNSLPKTNEQKRQYFMKSISTITHRNLKTYFEKWGLHPDNDTLNTFNNYPEPAVDITENLLPGNDDPIEDNILPSIEIPTGTPRTVKYVLGEQPDDFKIDDLLELDSIKNLPSGDKFTPTAKNMEIITFNDVLENSGVKVKLTNDQGQSNIISIPGSKSYGNAISMAAYGSEERAIFTLQKKTHTLETYTNEELITNLSQSVSFKLLDKDGKLKKEASAQASDAPQDFIHALRNISYVTGDIVEIEMSVAGKLQSYKAGEVDLKRDDSKKIEYFRIENDQFVHLDATAAIPSAEANNQSIEIGEALPKVTDFVKNVTGLFGKDNIELTFEKELKVNQVGEQDVTIVLKDKVYGTTTKITSKLDVKYGNALALAAYSPSDVRSILRLDSKTHQWIGFTDPDRKNTLNGVDSKYWELKVIRNGETIKTVSAQGTDEPFDFTNGMNGLDYKEGDMISLYTQQKYLTNYHDNTLVDDQYETESYFKIEKDQFVHISATDPTITVVNKHLLYEKDESVTQDDLLKEAQVKTETGNQITSDFSTDLLKTLGDHTVTVTATNLLTGTKVVQEITVTVVNPSTVLNGSLNFTDEDPKLTLHQAKEVHLALSSQSSIVKDVKLVHQFVSDYLSLGSQLNQRLPGQDWTSQTIDPSQPLSLSLDQIKVDENYELKYDIIASNTLSVDHGDQWKVTYSYINTVDDVQKTYTKTLDLSLKTETQQNTNPDGGDATTLKKTGTITFRADDQPSNPVDPENPHQTVVPDEPINSNGAELMITYASPLNFGQHSKTETSWHAQGDSVKNTNNSDAPRLVAPFVSIKDSRGTERKGWQLLAIQDDDFKDDDGNLLKGATLTYSDLHYAEQENSPVTSSRSIVLSKTASLIAQADSTQGSGNTSLALGVLNEKNQTTGVTLDILPGMAINSKVYQTTVTYELVAGL